MFEFMNSGSKILTLEQIERFETDPYEIYLSGFWKCSPEILATAEDALGYPLPSQLRLLYLEAGVGTVRKKDVAEELSYNNILIPTDIPKLLNGTCGWTMPYATETEMEPDTLPFFERAIDLYLCLRPHSENPNAVYWMWGEKMPNGEKICDSLVEFFQKLVEDPDWFNPSKP